MQSSYLDSIDATFYLSFSAWCRRKSSSWTRGRVHQGRISGLACTIDCVHNMTPSCTQRRSSEGASVRSNYSMWFVWLLLLFTTRLSSILSESGDTFECFSPKFDPGDGCSVCSQLEFSHILFLPNGCSFDRLCHGCTANIQTYLYLKNYFREGCCISCMTCAYRVSRSLCFSLFPGPRKLRGAEQRHIQGSGLVAYGLRHHPIVVLPGRVIWEVFGTPGRS